MRLARYFNIPPLTPFTATAAPPQVEEQEPASVADLASVAHLVMTGVTEGPAWEAAREAEQEESCLSEKRVLEALGAGQRSMEVSERAASWRAQKHVQHCSR